MKRLLVRSVVVLLTLGLYPSVVKEIDPLTRQERFALDLKACQEAYASATPTKCALFGRIQVVDSFPDVKIERVTAFPDIRVQWVDAFADGPGKWERVTAFPDYRVQFVTAFPDHKVQFVDAFPGCD